MPLNKHFEAILRDEHGKIFEIGRAIISDSGNFIDFTGEFVPLMDIRATASITKTIDGVECHRFLGKVYLSSKTRLRLSDIQDSLIGDTELNSPLRINIPGKAQGIITHHTAKLINMGATSQEVKTAPCNVFYISAKEIGFTISSHHHNMATQLLITVNEISLPDIEVTVNRRLAYNSDTTACYANIEAMPPETQHSLTSFLTQKLILHP